MKPTDERRWTPEWGIRQRRTRAGWRVEMVRLKATPVAPPGGRSNGKPRPELRYAEPVLATFPLRTRPGETQEIEARFWSLSEATPGKAWIVLWPPQQNGRPFMMLVWLTQLTALTEYSRLPDPMPFWAIH